MTEEEKNEVTEEAKEETHKLTEEELKQVTGGLKEHGPELDKPSQTL